jgi:DNA polymerase-1
MTGANEDDVRSAMAVYDRVYPEIRRAGNRWQREARANGMVTVTVTGRRLPLDRDRAYAVTNYQVQSAARDVLGQALIEMDASGCLPYLRLPIHDEVLASAPKAEAADIAREIERCMGMTLAGVPITATAEIGGRSWGSLYGSEY